MARGKMVRVTTAHLDKARELLPQLPDKRLGPTERRDMNDRELLDVGMGWFIGRLQGDVFTKAEVDATVMRTLVDVMGRTLGVNVNGVSVDGAFTLTYTAPDGIRHEQTVTLEA